jgi:hypothetical protein
MAPRPVDPPITPAQRPAAPQPASQPAPANRPNPAAITRPPAGAPANAPVRQAPRRTGPNDTSTTRGAKGVAGQPPSSGARPLRVVRPPNGAGADDTDARGGFDARSVRAALFAFTKPPDGLPPQRNAEAIAILEDLIARLPTLDDGNLGDLARAALHEEIARHRELVVRGNKGVSG